MTQERTTHTATEVAVEVETNPVAEPATQPQSFTHPFKPAQRQPAPRTASPSIQRGRTAADHAAMARYEYLLSQPKRSKTETLKEVLTAVKSTNLRTLAALALAGIVAIGAKTHIDSAATEKGTEARTELLAKLPTGVQISEQDLTMLQCIIARASRTCGNVVGTDHFEDEQCDTDKLDAMKISEGQDMAITGYAKAAKAVAAKAGLDTQLICQGPREDKTLDINVYTAPIARPDTNFIETTGQ